MSSLVHDRAPAWHHLMAVFPLLDTCLHFHRLQALKFGCPTVPTSFVDSHLLAAGPQCASTRVELEFQFYFGRKSTRP